MLSLLRKRPMADRSRGPGLPSSSSAAWGLADDRHRLGTDRPLVDLLDDVVGGAFDVEVEAPVGVVAVHHAGHRVGGGGEAEAGPDGAVVAEPPVAGVAVPAGLQLADDAQLLAVVVEGDALEAA